MKKVWHKSGERLYLDLPSEQIPVLENAVYSIRIDEVKRPFLVKLSDEFNFGYKLYALDKGLVEKVIKTFVNTSKNLGVLLNGTRGTGKSVTAKLIANALEQPCILLDNGSQGLVNFVNSIPQNITIFCDEYEKTFEDSSSLLTIMDGAAESIYRRVFLLTTNKLFVQENLLQRPSRIRYIKEFGNLSIDEVKEILTDKLNDTSLVESSAKFIATLELITVDIVSSLAEEINIHHEPIEAFHEIFNVKRSNSSVNLYCYRDDGSKILLGNYRYVHTLPATRERVGQNIELASINDYNHTQAVIIYAHANGKATVINTYDEEETPYVIGIEECYSSYYAYGRNDIEVADTTLRDIIFADHELAAQMAERNANKELPDIKSFHDDDNEFFAENKDLLDQ